LHWQVLLASGFSRLVVVGDTVAFTNKHLSERVGSIVKLWLRTAHYLATATLIARRARPRPKNERRDKYLNAGADYCPHTCNQRCEVRRSAIWSERDYRRTLPGEICMPADSAFGTFGRFRELPLEEMPPAVRDAYEFTKKLR
jgi:hypothetical protein